MANYNFLNDICQKCYFFLNFMKQLLYLCCLKIEVELNQFMKGTLLLFL